MSDLLTAPGPPHKVCMGAVGPVPTSHALSPTGSVGDSDPLRSQWAGVRAAPKPRAAWNPGAGWGGGSRLGQGCLGLPRHPEFLALGRWWDGRASPPGFSSTKSPKVLASRTPGDLTLGSCIGRTGLKDRSEFNRPREMTVEHLKLRAEQTAGQGAWGCGMSGWVGVQEAENLRVKAWRET